MSHWPSAGFLFLAGDIFQCTANFQAMEFFWLLFHEELRPLGLSSTLNPGLISGPFVAFKNSAPGWVW
jgi:hypothetical protein